MKALIVLLIALAAAFLALMHETATHQCDGSLIPQVRSRCVPGIETVTRRDSWPFPYRRKWTRNP